MLELKGKHFITMKILANRSIGKNFSSKGCLALSLASLYPLIECRLGYSDIKEASEKIITCLMKHRSCFVGSDGFIKNLADIDKPDLVLGALPNPDSKVNRKILSDLLKTKIFRIGGNGPNHFVAKFSDGTVYDPALPFFINDYNSYYSYYADEERRIVGMRLYPFASYLEVKASKF